MRIFNRSVAVEHIERSCGARSIFRTPAAIVVLCLPVVCGCSISLPGASMASRVDEDVTGSIVKTSSRSAVRPAPAISPLSNALDAEDWRRARAALGTALDPQGNGATVAWDNPQSGRRGSFVPVAAPYPVDGQVCRAFIARITTSEAGEQVQGSACRIGGTDDWDVKDVRPFKAG